MHTRAAGTGDVPRGSDIKLRDTARSRENEAGIATDVALEEFRLFRELGWAWKSRTLDERYVFLIPEPSATRSPDVSFLK